MKSKTWDGLKNRDVKKPKAEKKEEGKRHENAEIKKLGADKD